MRRAVVIVQQFRGAADQGFGQSGRPRYGNAETLFSAPSADFAQAPRLFSPQQTGELMR